MRRNLNFIFPMGALLMLSAFTFGTPFRTAEGFDEIPANTYVTVGITHVITGNDKAKNDIFWDHTMRVVDSLASHKGYLGHKIRRQFFGNEAWTMTVWEDEASLQNFVVGKRHQDAIKNGLDALVKARFVRFKITKSGIPISWDDAEKIMDERGRDLYGRYQPDNHNKDKK
jgi:heme-degrading monooxygenase HmoA